MAIIVSGKSFVPAPEGLHNAVCVDVIDMGLVEGAFGKKHTIRLVWELDALMEDQRRFVIQRRYTASLHEKSQLFKDLKSWRGKPFTPEELNGFDLEKLVGAPCQILVEHADREGTTYANVKAIMKADPSRKLIKSGDYVRVKDREDERQAVTTPAGEDEDTIPF